MIDQIPYMAIAFLMVVIFDIVISTITAVYKEDDE